MFVKSCISGLAAIATLLLSGCITTETTIKLNPDGSGTVEYTSNYDRASDEVREKIRAQMASPGTRSRNSKEALLNDYPTPHFELVAFEEDQQTLRNRMVLHFNDINALLIRREKTDLGLKALDFEVDGERLVFSIKEEKSTHTWPEKFDDTPGKETISIINAATGETISFSRELTSQTPPANWSATLDFPGHHMIRTPNLRIFHDYPVVTTDDVRIDSAKWVIESDQPLSRLAFEATVHQPQDGFIYLQWKNPVVLSGHYLPDLGNQSRVNEAWMLQNHYPSNPTFLNLGYAAPNQPIIESISPTVVRLEAARSQGTTTVKVGKLAPDTEYKCKDFVLKTGSLENEKLNFEFTGDSRRVKNALIQTRRGNRFVLKKSSGGTSSFSYFKSIPLTNCTLFLELYNPLEPCYLDLALPALDLMQRNWKEEKTAAASKDWKKAVIAEYPDLANTEVPPFDASLFEDKATYSVYFQNLRNDQLLPALFRVVDYMVQHKPKNGQMWIQTEARTEINKRQEFLEGNRPQITDRLFCIYAHTPKEMGCLRGFFSTLRLRELAQPKAIEMLRQNRLRFANTSFFGTTLSEEEVAVLKQTFEQARQEDWVAQKEILEILDRTKCIDKAYALQLLEGQTLSKYVRSDALRLLMRMENPDYGLAERIALDESEESTVRLVALSALLEHDPFPTQALLACLSNSDCRGGAINALDSFLKGFLRDHADDAEACAKMEQTLQPTVLWMEDISELSTDWKARTAASILKNLEKLRSPQTP